MKRTLTTGLLAVGLVSAGWTAGGAAQAPQGDFALQVRDMPDGWTTVECTRGCSLQFSLHLPARDEAQTALKYNGAAAELRGWIVSRAPR